MTAVVACMMSLVVSTDGCFATLSCIIATSCAIDETPRACFATLRTDVATRRRSTPQNGRISATRERSSGGVVAVTTVCYPGNVALHGVNATLCAHFATLRMCKATLTRSSVAMYAIIATGCDKSATAGQMSDMTSRSGFVTE